MLQIKVDSTNINTFTFEHIFQQVNLALAQAGSSGTNRRSIRLDISQAHFLDPYSIINLLLVIRWLNKYFSEIQLAPPRSQKATSYLKRMNFFFHLPKKVNIEDTSFRRSKHIPARKKESDVLLELTPIQNEQDIHKVVNHAITKIAHILTRNLGYLNTDIAAFCTALAETCQNIKDHSQDQGLVAVQKYHADRNYVVIGVCDLGIGIKRSLAQRYSVHCWGHRQAIKKSMELGISRLRERGKGLYLVKDIINKYQGTQLIRSGSGTVRIASQKTQAFSSSFFPGTQIYLKLPAIS